MRSAQWDFNFHVCLKFNNDLPLGASSFFEYYIIKPIFFIAMIDLLISTFAMMGLTFLIGFFVAAVIKLIAYAADSFDFYSSHRLELLRLHRWRQHRQKVERLVRQMPLPDEGTLGDYREDFSRGINRNVSGYSGYYHGVSPGASEENLMDYYYPRIHVSSFSKKKNWRMSTRKIQRNLLPTNNKMTFIYGKC